MSKRYTKTELISELHRFVEENGRVPNAHDMLRKHGYPSYSAYRDYFGTWEYGLRFANLPLVSDRLRIIRDNRKCYICKSTKSTGWYKSDGKYVCNKCKRDNRNYMYGVLDPNSNCGVGVITEHIVAEYLNDAIKCNTTESFASKYDLISNKYGAINVKSAKRIHYRNGYIWQFRIHKSSKIPDYYFCIGFNKDRSNIEYAWAIPSLMHSKNTNITIRDTERHIKNFIYFELDTNKLNEIYINIDLTQLSEFRHLTTIVDIYDAQNK